MVNFVVDFEVIFNHYDFVYVPISSIHLINLKHVEISVIGIHFISKKSREDCNSMVHVVFITFTFLIIKDFLCVDELSVTICFEVVIKITRLVIKVDVVITHVLVITIMVFMMNVKPFHLIVIK